MILAKVGIFVYLNNIAVLYIIGSFDSVSYAEYITTCVMVIVDILTDNFNSVSWWYEVICFCLRVCIFRTAPCCSSTIANICISAWSRFGAWEFIQMIRMLVCRKKIILYGAERTSMFDTTGNGYWIWSHYRWWTHVIASTLNLRTIKPALVWIWNMNFIHDEHLFLLL